MDGHRRQTAVNAFYIEGGRLSPEDARHAAKVLRLRPGDEIVALDGAGGRFRARLKEEGSVELLERLPSNEPRLRLTVYQGVPKADKLELLAQKLTELGVTRLVPVEMERSVRHFEKVERLRKIAREAAKQCRRALPMEITEPMPWQKAVLDMRARERLVAPVGGSQRRPPHRSAALHRHWPAHRPPKRHQRREIAGKRRENRHPRRAHTAHGDRRARRDRHHHGIMGEI